MSDDDFGDDAPVRAQSYRRGGGRGRGRGGGGSRGGRGGSRGGFDDDGYGGGWDSSRHDDDDNGESGFGGGRGRGRRGYNDDDENGERGYGGGRGRGGRGRGGFGGGGDEERGFGGRSREEGEAGDGEKPKERYIPPEPTNDENELFGSGTTAGINFDQYENIKIKVSGENPVPAVDSFESCGLREFVYNNVKKSGYSKPTPVQKRAIPIIMAGRDLMACAQTGSGKTAAFLVPIINTLLDRPKDAVINEAGVEPQAVIMSPTRELAIQIFNEARKFAHGSILKVCIAYGGTVAYAQGNALMRGCHILVATPGRLNDFVNRERITFSSIRFFVLDEADRMLDMGFLPEIEKMLKHNTMPSPDARQTLMFSATFPPDIQRLAGNYFNNYLFLAVGIVGGACADVEQVFYEVPKFEKKEKLADILRESGGKQLTLVFVELKRNADFVAAFLCENKIPTTSIHGDRLQSQREQALGDFRSGRKPTLIATGVASRGLDIKNVAHVINFDLPNSIDEYVHRIGRTGRVGNRGKATSFFDPSHDSAIAGELVKILSQCNQPIPAFLESAGGPGGGDNGGFDGDSFGGRDVRKGRHDGGGFSAPAAQEVDEDW